MSNHYVYILASRRNGTLYVGVTGDLLRRALDRTYWIPTFVGMVTRGYGYARLLIKPTAKRTLSVSDRHPCRRIFVSGNGTFC